MIHCLEESYYRHLGIKRSTYVSLALIAKLTLKFFIFNMVQTKLSVAFILAAVAISPIVAVPLRAVDPEQTKMAVEPKASSEAGSNAEPIVAPEQPITAEVERKPHTNSGVGEQLEQLPAQPTSQGTGNHKANRLKHKGHKHTGKVHKHKGHKHKGHKHKGHKHKGHKHKSHNLKHKGHKRHGKGRKGSDSESREVTVTSKPHKAHRARAKVHSLENSDVLSDSAENPATDLAARDDSEMFERSFEPEYEAREYVDLD